MYTPKKAIFSYWNAFFLISWGNKLTVGRWSRVDGTCKPWTNKYTSYASVTMSVLKDIYYLSLTPTKQSNTSQRPCDYSKEAFVLMSMSHRVSELFSDSLEKQHTNIGMSQMNLEAGGLYCNALYGTPYKLCL